jgi:hypothetical protein
MLVMKKSIRNEYSLMRQTLLCATMKPEANRRIIETIYASSPSDESNLAKPMQWQGAKNSLLDNNNHFGDIKSEKSEEQSFGQVFRSIALQLRFNILILSSFWMTRRHAPL